MSTSNMSEPASPIKKNDQKHDPQLKIENMKEQITEIERTKGFANNEEYNKTYGQ